MRKSSESLTRHPLVPLALVSSILLALAGTGSAQVGPPHPVPPVPAPPFSAPPGQADKIVVMSSTLEVLEGRLAEEEPVVVEAEPVVPEEEPISGDEATPNAPVELLRTSFDRRAPRAPGADDLIVRVDAECAGLINVAAQGGEIPPEPEPEPEEPAPEQEQEPAGTDTRARSVAVTAWLELDGVPVPVSGAPADEFGMPDDGKVVLCQSTESADFAATETDAFIEHFDALRTAGGFTWTLPGGGAGAHELVLMAQLDLTAEETAEDGEEEPVPEPEPEEPVPPEEPEQEEVEDEVDALGFVGKRILVAEFTKATFEETGEF